MHFRASCNGPNENLCAEGCHGVETGNGSARETNKRRHGKPCESCDRGKALVVVEEAAGRNGFSRFERLQVYGRGRALTGLGDPSPLYMTAFGL